MDKYCRAFYGEAADQLNRWHMQRYRTWSFVGFMCQVRGSVLGELWPWCLFFGLISFAEVAVSKWVYKLEFRDDYHRLLIFPISFFLVFRANAAYARFWEGRKHFGTFNFALRELTRRTYTFIRDTAEGPVDSKSKALRQNMMRMLMVLSISVRQNLRKRSAGKHALERNLEQVSRFLTEQEREEYKKIVKNRPLLVMSWIGKYVHEANLESKLEGGQIMMGFDDNISKCLQGWMGMNKISYQPMPFPYLHTLHWFILAWCISLPMALVAPLDWLAVPAATFIALAIYAIEEVSEEIEDPFGDDLNDLPTENFEIGLQRDARLVLSGPGPGPKKQCFEHVGEYGVDFSLPVADLTENERKPVPSYHVWDLSCKCPSCRPDLHREYLKRQQATNKAADLGLADDYWAV